MMKLIANKALLMEQLAQGACVVTPNKRLSLSLLENYYRYRGEKTCAKPLCQPLSSLIKSIYQRLLTNGLLPTDPVLLSTDQCRYLWEQTLKSGSGFTYSKGLLHAVIDAWSKCLQWQISPEDKNFASTPQCAQFQHWWQDFNKRIKVLNALPEEQLMDYLIASHQPLLPDSPLSKPTQLIWVCFDHFSPQQQALQHHLAGQGVENCRYDLGTEANGCSWRLSAKDEEDEYRQLIQWIRHRLDKGDQKIAVVVPDLQQRSRSLQRQLKRQIKEDMFNISLGQPLAQYPLVAHALSWIALDTRQISSQQAHLLLYSPYLKGSEMEFHERTQAAQDSSLLREKRISLSVWMKSLRHQTPVLVSCLEQLNRYPEKASLDEWIDCFSRRLHHLGFPGDSPLNSENHQCFQRFTQLFDAFRQLSFCSSTLTDQEAVHAFTELAKQSVFQPESKQQKPVQILGLLEASGCEFNSLWCMGLTDQCLPAKTALSPFIPQSLQRSQNMPHSSPEREWQLAEKLIHRFQRSSPLTVFSYPGMSADIPNLPSPLITDLPELKPIPLSDNGLACTPLKILRENYFIPLQPGEPISGGTALLANQAKCPFRAFAAHRLKAKASRGMKDGLDPQERGQIMHKVMENLWRSLGSQQQLLSLDEQALDRCIEAAITHAIEVFFIDKNELLQDIELTRLKRLLQSCLVWEKQRPPFTVEAIEKDFTLRIHHLDFKVRVDRIDRVEGEVKWVIDYKSSIPAGQPWSEDRPTEPQLLLYALLDDSIKALLFIQLKGGQISSKSFSEEDLNLPSNLSLKENERWSDYRERWQQQLDQLAEEFSKGYCAPQPLSPSICTQCEFQSLCRFTLNQLN